jgi:hypothetical protein
MTVPAKQHAAADIMESVIAKGDLGKLTPEERVQFYQETCRSLGLNPLTQPFSYITLNNKLTLYATRACTDQLRKVNGVSLEIVSREVVDDILTMHVRAKLPDGRTDEDLGAVPFPATLKGEFRANAELKCVTKAKRRATLSICGLGWLDETEIDDIPASAKRRPSGQVGHAAPNVALHDPETGEVKDDKADWPDHSSNRFYREKPDDKPEHSAPAPAPAPVSTPAVAGAGLSSDDLEKFDAELTTAAESGKAALQIAFKKLPDEAQRTLRKGLERRHWPRAVEVDAMGRS